MQYLTTVRQTIAWHEYVYFNKETKNIKEAVVVDLANNLYLVI